ncbi:hypothetical protein EVAR_36880_1 [Eumeta japonica]|uniref:Uncharacterized protein n=1 Tax=Eumeta variegata TaxID=151549 RepID=A0A4C1WV58_EUMVA|nr:hypothetical protein EVAR_36880_1 [Eumeta japonica]
MPRHNKTHGAGIIRMITSPNNLEPATSSMLRKLIHAAPRRPRRSHGRAAFHQTLSSCQLSDERAGEALLFLELYILQKNNITFVEGMNLSYSPVKCEFAAVKNHHHQRDDQVRTDGFNFFLGIKRNPNFEGNENLRRFRAKPVRNDELATGCAPSVPSLIYLVRQLLWRAAWRRTTPAPYVRVLDTAALNKKPFSANKEAT